MVACTVNKSSCSSHASSNVHLCLRASYRLRPYPPHRGPPTVNKSSHLRDTCHLFLELQGSRRPRTEHQVLSLPPVLVFSHLPILMRNCGDGGLTSVRRRLASHREGPLLSSVG